MEDKICQNCKKDFVIEPEDFNFYEKIKVPPPVWCPKCRLLRRMNWYGYRILYKRKCDFTGENIITFYHPDLPVKIYKQDIWWSDKWDPKSYGRDYDFSKNFFKQYKDLILKVPHLALVNDDGIASVNCEYTQDFAFSKNCYMSFIGWKVENVMYTNYISAGKDIVDCMNIKSKSDFIYECIRCATSYKLKYSQNSKSCIDCAFMVDCLNCSDCLMCVGIQNKKYFYKNQEYSPDAYKKILENYKLDTFSGVEKAQKEFDEFSLNFPKRYVYNFRVLNCTGDITSDSKNSKECFNVKRAENCKWVVNSDTPKDSYDLTIGGELSECYEGITSDHSSRNFFGIFSWKDQDVEYTQHCHSSKSLFGCVGVKSKKYCIFNKQYSKEEYEILVEKIKKQMDEMPYIDHIGNSYGYGEFYPAELSPFGYNETVGMEHFPLEKTEALKKGYSWQENVQRTIGKETLKPENIPENINDINESILNEVLACIECNRNYKITANELIFYKKINIPIPRRCFYCRHTARVKRRNPYKLWHRKCMCDGSTSSPQAKKHNNHEGECKEEFETSFSPDRPEVVYCEKCYQQEVY